MFIQNTLNRAQKVVRVGFVGAEWSPHRGGQAINVSSCRNAMGQAVDSEPQHVGCRLEFRSGHLRYLR